MRTTSSTGSCARLGQWLGKNLSGKRLVAARVGLTVRELTGGLVYGHRTARPGMRNELVK